MSGQVFVDTNVLLYTFDDAYPAKRDRARPGWRRAGNAVAGG